MLESVAMRDNGDVGCGSCVSGDAATRATNVPHLDQIYLNLSPEDVIREFQTKW